MTEQIDLCPCLGPSCGRDHRGDDPCHCPEFANRDTWHGVIVPAATEPERLCIHGDPIDRCHGERDDYRHELESEAEADARAREEERWEQEHDDAEAAAAERAADEEQAAYERAHRDSPTRWGW